MYTVISHPYGVSFYTFFQGFPSELLDCGNYKGYKRVKC